MEGKFRIKRHCNFRILLGICWLYFCVNLAECQVDGRIYGSTLNVRRTGQIISGRYQVTVYDEFGFNLNGLFTCAEMDLSYTCTEFDGSLCSGDNRNGVVPDRCRDVSNPLNLGFASSRAIYEVPLGENDFTREISVSNQFNQFNVVSQVVRNDQDVLNFRFNVLNRPPQAVMLPLVVARIGCPTVLEIPSRQGIYAKSTTACVLSIPALQLLPGQSVRQVFVSLNIIETNINREDVSTVPLQFTLEFRAINRPCEIPNPGYDEVMSIFSTTGQVTTMRIESTYRNRLFFENGQSGNVVITPRGGVASVDPALAESAFDLVFDYTEIIAPLPETVCFQNLASLKGITARRDLATSDITDGGLPSVSSSGPFSTVGFSTIQVTLPQNTGAQTELGTIYIPEVVGPEVLVYTHPAGSTGFDVTFQSVEILGNNENLRVTACRADQTLTGVVCRCNPSPCQNGGTCSEIGVVCICPPGVSGVNCQIAPALSASPPTGDLNFPTTTFILSGEVCATVQFAANADGIVEGTESFQILLTSTSVNVDGNLDQFTINVVDADPCIPNPCNGGVCSNINNAPSCDCSATFFVGQFCNVPIEVMFQNIESLTIQEGTSGNRDVCIDPPVVRSVQVPFSLSVNPATGDIQFSPQNAIPPNQVCLTVQFTAILDAIQEAEESFQVSLTSSSVSVDQNSDQFTIVVPPNGNACNPNPCNGGICTVINNAASCNCAPTVNVGQFCTIPIEIQFQNIATALTINEGASQNTDVCLDPPLARTFAVSFSLGPTNADLTFPTSSSIPVGQTCTSVQFSAINDGLQEGPEAFQIFLTSQTVAVDTNQDQLTISVPETAGPCTPNPCNGGICSSMQPGSFVCDCSGTTFVGAQCDVSIEIQFSVQTATGIEGDGPVTVQVCLDPALPRTFQIPFGLSPTTNVASDLMVPSSGVINAMMPCADVTIGVVDDQIIESSETFSVIITSASPAGITIDPNQATLAITIIDNDDAEIRFSTSSISVLENVGTTSVDVCFTNVQSLLSDVVFTLVTNPVTASAGEFVVPLTGTISAGNMCTTITISIIDDQLVEPSEQFVVTLASVTTNNADINTNFDTFTVTIVDDDAGKSQTRIRVSVTLKSHRILFVTFQT
ncbi:Neurogenic locus notch-like protein 1 [Holothuria leucospilota]|uniref:Neurogenic locus notch-like protein 1 n=1 Tax=Holothuria leucospilota TaxID=206669 RepID=A0A9Q1BLF7_HOLLE|nr:Neurogenic locus notch-like protein 1 [Holothuria leucospilota]